MAKEIIIYGNVQGVFCRDYCSRYGRKFGLRGTASNQNNGTVQIILNTNDDELAEQYVQALKDNPNDYMFYGKITKIEVHSYSGHIRGDYVF